MQNNRKYETGKSIMLYFFRKQIRLECSMIISNTFTIEISFRTKLVYKYFLQIKILFELFSLR